MHIICINLDERADRRERMSNLFRKYEVKDWEILKATDTKDKIVLETNIQFPHLELAYIACSTSHARAWEKVANLEDDQWCLILEDDVFFHKKWKTILLSAIEQLPNDWELFMLDCYYVQGWDFTSDGDCGKEGIHKASLCSFADAYAITSKACKWLLNLRKQKIEEGEWLNNESLLMELQENEKSFTYIPKLALQQFDESDIQTKQLISNMDHFYKTVYFPRFGRELYDI